MVNSLNCQRGIDEAKRDLAHLREVVSNRRQLEEAILRYIDHKTNVEKKGPEFMRCYRAAMNHLWLRYLPGSQYRTRRIPGLKLRHTNETVLSKAYEFLEEVNG